MIISNLISYHASAGIAPAGAFCQKSKASLRFLTGLVLCFLLLSCLAPLTVHADDVIIEDYDRDNYEAYVTDSFDVEAVAEKNHTIHIAEDISVNFFQERHGIYRYIPVKYKYYKIDRIRVKNDEFESEFEMSGEDKNGTYGNEIVRIGSPYSYVYGPHDYHIAYDMVCNDDDSDEEDYLSLDILPTGWKTGIKSAELSLTMPEKIDWDSVQINYGKYGSASSIKAGEDDGNFSSRVSEDGKTLIIRGKRLEKGVGVTISAKLEEGYWQGAPSVSGLKPLIAVIPILFALLMTILWVINGRDPSVVKPVEFYPPRGLTPAEVGYIVDGRLDDKDLSSMIMYYASKGWIAIEEIGDGKEYKLIKKAEISEEQPAFSRTIFKGLFKGASVNGNGEPEVMMDGLPSTFAEDIQTAKDQIKSYYDEGRNKMFTTGSQVARFLGKFITLLPIPIVMALAALTSYRMLSAISALIPFLIGYIGLNKLMSAFDRKYSVSKASSTFSFIAGIAVIAAAVVMASAFILMNGLGILAVIILAVSIAVGVTMEVLMWARTEENALLLGEILGFREFIRTAEYDRLKAISAENPSYYYDTVPYAFVMGMSVAWAKKFESLNIPEPDWYQGNRPISSPVFYCSMMNSYSRDFTSQSIVIDSADGGGFFDGGSFGGGGGFSGGGFGGGGGGSW